MVWPCAAAADLMPVITSSNSLCLISKPLPLAMTGSPNSEFIAATGLAFVSVAAEFVSVSTALEFVAVADGIVESAVTAFARDNVNNTANTAEKITFISIFILGWSAFSSIGFNNLQ